MTLTRKLLSALTLTFSFGSAIAQTPLLNCTIPQGGEPTFIRKEGLAEAVDDLVINCTGGTPITPGQALPAFNLQLSFNSNLTSRPIYSASSTWSEVLLVIDDPLPGNQRPCLDGSGYCSAVSGSPAPNIFQGVVTGPTSVAFYNVPLDPPGPYASRRIRVTNLRVNATQLGYYPTTPMPAVVTLAASGGITLAVDRMQTNLAYTFISLDAQVRSADGAASLSQAVPFQSCLGVSDRRLALLHFGEVFHAGLRPKAAAARQEVPGVNYGTETLFNPNLPTGAANRNIGLAGLASSGTRLRARFTNVPSGVTVRVGAVPVTMVGGSPVVNAPEAIQAVISAPASADTAIGGIPAATVPIVGGSGEAVWEVTQASRTAIETIDFPVWISAAPGAAALGTASVSIGLAPPSSENAASPTAPLPRFYDGFHLTSPLFTSLIDCGCTYSLSSYSTTLSYLTGSGAFNVNCFSDCPWTAVPNAPWITITQGASGLGNGTVNFTITASPSYEPRTATITVGGAVHTVTQVGNPGCTGSLNTSRLDALAGAGSYSFMVQYSGGCPWTAVSDVPWVTITRGTGSGYGPVDFTYAANPSSSPRAGSIRINSLTFAVVQAGQTFDEPATAPDLTLPFHATFAAATATSNPADPVHSCGTLTRDSSTVWFRYNSRYTGTLRVTTRGSGYDTVLSAYSGGVAPGAELACNDNHTGLTSQIDVPVVFGSPVLIEVSARGPATPAASLELELFAPTVPGIDTNRDGKSDILWQHPANGDAWWWSLNGAAVQGYGFIGWNASYRIAASGDFNRDGHTDVIVQHPSTGEAYVWFLINGAYSSYAGISGPTSCRLVGAADFDRDGHLDLYWQLPGTDLAWIWYMTGASYSSSRPASGSTAFRVAATGDLDGDGGADILWQHTVTRELWVWHLDVIGLLSFKQLTGPQAYDVAGIGDYNGDGKTDLLWQHPTNGDVWVWYLDGEQFAGHAAVSGPMAYKVFGRK